MENMYKNILSLFDENLKNAISCEEIAKMEEIRLRSGKHAEIVFPEKRKTLGIISSPEDIFSCVRRALRYSLFANEEEIRLGRIVIPGGHRVSFFGRAVRREGVIISQDNFSGLCVRIAREKKGCSDRLMKYVISGGQVLSTLIISPPGIGKTTVLRDLARNISTGEKALRCVIIDEKGEIASNVGGMNYLDVGERSDVLTLFDKPSGINMAVRNMNPEVIFCDEIGSPEDSASLSEAVRCGVKIIATAHGENISGLMERKDLSDTVNSRIFDRYIFISRNNDKVFPKKIYDRKLSEVMI